jgi:hypothetical protein
VIPIPGESISGWPHIVAAVIEGLGFSLVILVFAAMWRRRHLRIGPNLRRPLRAPLTYVWQRDQVLDVGQLQWISRQFHQWPGVEASKGAHPMRGMR